MPMSGPRVKHLGLAAILKDETPHLREWVDFHLLAGIERFVLYDNGSAEPVAETLAPYVQAGLIRVLDWPGAFRQMDAYRHCLAEFGDAFRWLAFLDADEFLFAVDRDLRSLLLDFEDVGGLAVNWVLYGSGGHESRPPGFQIENYRLRPPLAASVNRHVKSLVRPECAAGPLSVHHFAFRDGRHCVTERLLPTFGPYAPHSIERVRVNHYYFRSREDFEAKIARGMAHPIRGRDGYVFEEFDRQAAWVCEEDDSALRFLPRLRFLGRQDDARAAADLADRWAQLPAHEALELARTQASRGDADAAGETLRISLFHHPENTALRLALAAALRGQGRPEEALACVRKALALGATPEAYLELARVEAARGRDAAAANVLAFLRWSLEREGLLDGEWLSRLERI